jgi:hypothetical protein
LQLSSFGLLQSLGVSLFFVQLALGELSSYVWPWCLQSNRIFSMGGMCRSLAQYACRIKRTGHRKEIVDDIDQDIKALLQLFKQRNGVKPESIVVYRDGVSQGEFREVRCILTPSWYAISHSQGFRLTS